MNRVKEIRPKFISKRINLHVDESETKGADVAAVKPVKCGAPKAKILFQGSANEIVNMSKKISMVFLVGACGNCSEITNMTFFHAAKIDPYNARIMFHVS